MTISLLLGDGVIFFYTPEFERCREAIIALDIVMCNSIVHVLGTDSCLLLSYSLFQRTFSLTDIYLTTRAFQNINNMSGTAVYEEFDIVFLTQVGMEKIFGVT